MILSILSQEFGSNISDLVKQEKDKRLLRLVLEMWYFIIGWCVWINSLKSFGLCLSHYLSAPALSWNAMLNMTKVQLELVPDLEMFIFFEKKYKRLSFLYF